MRKTAVLLAALVISPVWAHAQLLLNQGDTYTYSFAAGQVPYAGSGTPAFHGQYPFGTVEFTLTGLDSGEQIRCDMFENSTSQAPIVTSGLIPSSEGFLVAGIQAWLDGQGAVQFTMVSGSATLDRFKIGYQIPAAGYTTFDFFQLAVVPVPEPSVTALAAAGIAALVCASKRLKRRH